MSDDEAPVQIHALKPGGDKKKAEKPKALGVWTAIHYPNGDTYHGQVDTHGRKHGVGLYIRKNGDQYEGQFENDKRNGLGVYTFHNGNKYEGEVKDGNRNGLGVWIGNTGDRFSGEFFEGKGNGLGVLVLANGVVYSGEIKDDNRNGFGVYTFETGDRYEGQFLKGVRHGAGVFTFANGDTYVGEFLNGKRNGRGVRSYRRGRPGAGDGGVLSPAADEGIWEDNRFVKHESVQQAKDEALQACRTAREQAKKGELISRTAVKAGTRARQALGRQKAFDTRSFTPLSALQRVLGLCMGASLMVCSMVYLTFLRTSAISVTILAFNCMVMGAIIIIVEIRLPALLSQVRFLERDWGRGVFHIFVGTLAIGTGVGGVILGTFNILLGIINILGDPIHKIYQAYQAKKRFPAKTIENLNKAAQEQSGDNITPIYSYQAPPSSSSNLTVQ